MSLASFFGSLKTDGQLLTASFLTLAVIAVNGWTDAPNAIATAVSTRALKPKIAVAIAAVMNFFGVLLTSSVNCEVAKTIYSIADFGGSLPFARTALAASMSAVVLWALIAWCFGIPTSESHAIIAGVTGASVALHGSFSGISVLGWSKVIFGLVFSAALSFLLGAVISAIVKKLFSKTRRCKANSLFERLQIAVSCATAFFHGAQDGQKFIGVFLLCVALSEGKMNTDIESVPFFLTVICSVTMTLGTALGGKRIIKSVGLDMVSLEKYQGFSSDAAASLCLVACTALGLPVSTTNVKGTAVMGAAASRRLRSVNWSVAKNMLLAWLITFPACFLLSFAVTKLYFLIFL